MKLFKHAKPDKMLTLVPNRLQNVLTCCHALVGMCSFQTCFLGVIMGCGTNLRQALWGRLPSTLRRFLERQRLHRWLRTPHRGTQVYEGPLVDRIEIRDLVPCHTLHAIEVDTLWRRYNHTWPWGRSASTLQALISSETMSHVGRMPITWLIRNATFSGTEMDHCCRIGLMSCALTHGLRMRPLLILEDGSLVDGFHRLAALRLANVRVAEAQIAKLSSRAAEFCRES